MNIRPIRGERTISRTDLVSDFGSRARLSENLNRRRALTIDMVRKLNHELDLPFDLLMQPYALERSAPRVRASSPVSASD